MQLTTSLLVALSAGSAIAAPHMRHQQFHEKRAVGDLVTAVIDGKTVSWINTYDGGAGAAAAPAAPAAAPAPAPANTASTPAAAPASNAPAPAAASSAAQGPTAGVKSFTPFCGSASNQKRQGTTEADIKFAGNTGAAAGCKWGSNLMLVSGDIANQYDHVTKFTTAGGEDQTCECFNKAGADGQPNSGAWFSALSFTVPANGAAYMAADAGSIGGCSCQAGGAVQKDGAGQWANSLYEFEFASEKNNGWNGFDASAIVPGSQGMGFQGMKVCQSGDNDNCSWFVPGASVGQAQGTTWSNSYLTGEEAASGIGYNVPKGKTSVEVTLGYTG